MMFLPFPTNINTEVILDNFYKIREDYNRLKDTEFVDYGEDIIPSELFKGKNTTQGHFWQIRPVWWLYEPLPGMDSETINILKQLNIKPLYACFSRLAPNTSIPTHSDNDQLHVDREDTTVVKYHITLEPAVDGDSYLCVGQEERLLRLGDVNCFDDSIPHSASNKGSTHRGAFIISWLRADLDLT